MNHHHFEAIQFIQKLAYLLQKQDFDEVEVSVHPPFTDLRSLQTLIDADQLRFKLGAQNCHSDDKGAFTGEISPVFLAKLGVQYVIVGHSERRQDHGETDAMVKGKAESALSAGLVASPTVSALSIQAIDGYSWPQGYIAINGASLTVAEADRRARWFEVWLIPETLERTNLSDAVAGRPVNVEVDIVAKYVREFQPDWERCWIAELDGEGEVVAGIAVARYGENALTVIDGLKR